MNYGTKCTETQAIYKHGLEKVKNTPEPEGQKFACGARVKIAKNLGSAMRHFPCNVFAEVKYVYEHAYSGTNVKSYCLDIDNRGEHSWYDENQLTLVKRNNNNGWILP